MAKDKEETAAVPPATGERRDARTMSTTALMGETAKQAIALVRAEIDLAKAELRHDLETEVQAAKGLTVATICALAVLDLLLVAGALALASVMPGWAAALVVAAAVALVGGIAAAFGVRHMKKPLARTRKTLKEDLQWMKQRTA